MVKEIIERKLVALEAALEEAWKEWRHHYGHERCHILKSGFTLSINNIKISFIMGSIKLNSGTPLTGVANPLDSKGNVLPNSAFKAGSCKFSVAAGSAFSVAAGATEENFVVTETNPGTTSTGTLLFDAQDVNGNQLPQSSLSVEFDAVPAVAVASQIVPDQTSL